jgi:hypothetical protein
MDPRIDTLTNCPELALILAQCRIEHGIDTLTIGQKISPPALTGRAIGLSRESKT